METVESESFCSLTEENDKDHVAGTVSTEDKYFENSNESNRPVTDMRPEVTNSFDGLCDGVDSAMALVHETMQDLLEFKDELLKHSLPPTVLIKLALISGRVFRSVSDLGVPVEELVRLARIYSTSWQEQSIPLIKLHENFDSKQKQLNIAVRRLQLIDEQSKQLARERCIMNWQKLFATVTTARSKGRRWKFLIKTIKEKAKLGFEHVQAYSKSFEESSKSEEGDAHSGQDDEVDQDQNQERTPGSEEENQLKGPESVTSEETIDSREDQYEEASTEIVQTEPVAVVSNQLAPTIAQFHEPVMRSALAIKPPLAIKPAVTFKLQVQDAQTWTQEPEFDRSLFVRMFGPEGLQQSQLKVSLSHNGNMFKTPVLDCPNETSDENKSTDNSKRPSDRPHAALNVSDKSHPGAVQTKPGPGPARRFCELQIQLPDEVPEGVSLLRKKPAPEPEALRFAVHRGKFEEIIAMASIDFQDIKHMNLETVYLPPADGNDDDVPGLRSRASSFSVASGWDEGSLSDSIDIPIMPDEESDQLKMSSPHEDLIKNKEPRLIPLYSLQFGRSDEANKPCGNVPVLMYWGKRVRPQHINRKCGTHGRLNKADIDLPEAEHEELQKETVDEALSVVAFTPRDEEEMVSKLEYDKMLELHEQEISNLHREYEQRMEELVENLQAMQNEKNLAMTAHRSQPTSRSSASSRAAGVMSPNTRQSDSVYGQGPNSAHSSRRPYSQERTMNDNLENHVQTGSSTHNHRPFPPRIQKQSKNFRIGRRLPRWGEHLPQDFFERLTQWEEESKQHKQELNERTLKEIKENLERKLEGQYKLSKQEEQIYDALRDVSLPALFMPFKTGNVFNPRAHHYFQPTGATNVRITQPPSVFQLPPLPNTRLSAVNLFELSKNFHIQGPAWLFEQYTDHIRPPVEEDCPHPPMSASALPQEISSEKAFLNENLDSRSISRDAEVES